MFGQMNGLPRLAYSMHITGYAGLVLELGVGNRLEVCQKGRTLAMHSLHCVMPPIESMACLTREREAE